MYIQTNYIDIKEVMDRVRCHYPVRTGFLASRFTEKDWLNLAGGIPHPSFDYFDFSVALISRNIFELRVDSSYHVVKRTVDLNEWEISNDSFIVNEELRGTGIGTKVFLNQVREAKKQNFSRLIVYAAGGSAYSDDNDYTGYFHWAKYGYEMFADYRKRFKTWLDEHNIQTGSLRQLVSNPYHYQLWKEEGFSWAGFFNLNDRVTLAFLQTYIESQKSKGFTYELWPEVFA